MARLRTVFPWVLVALTLALLAASAVVGALDASSPAGQAATGLALGLIGLAVLTPAAVGLVILRGRPANVIGWILVVGPVPVAVIAFASAYAMYGSDGSGGTLPGAAALGAVSVALWPAFYVWPLSIAFVFPDGRLPSRGWRWPVRAVFAAAGLMIAAGLVGTETGDGGAPNPFLVELPDMLGVIFWGVWWVLLAGLFLGAAAVIVRYRRSRGTERLQLKWLAWSASLIPFGLVFCAASYAVVGGVSILVPIVLLLAGIAVSISVGIAVTRHGLYEIDRIVNRTLVYATLTVVLVGGFAAIVLTAGLLLGRGSVVGTAVATLAVAVTFAPLRRRVQREVDRRFAKDRYAGLRRIRDFEDAVRRGAAEPEAVEAALAEALGDPGLRLWLRLPQSAQHADTRGRIALEEPSGGAVTRVAPHGEELALVVHDPSLRERPDLLRSVIGAATLPIELARLRAEVRVQLAEVEASRERLLHAGVEERRRLERDLHDGAQQRLVGLGVALRRMQRSLPKEARVLAPALDQAVEEVGRAIADLRTIAAGLRPPRLDDGLAAALGDLARSAPMTVVVDVTAEDLPPPIELVAYYTVCEAVTNAVKHASASRVDVEARRAGDRLTVRVRDDGAGGATPRGASGLAGVADRVAAAGGSLRIESPPGAGTLLEAEIPCAS